MSGQLPCTQGDGEIQGANKPFLFLLASLPQVQIEMYETSLDLMCRDHVAFRLTGAYAFIIFFHATLYNKFYPNAIDGQRDACRNYWWANIAYVNNVLHNGPAGGEVCEV